jgi:hypothetical protein
MLRDTQQMREEQVQAESMSAFHIRTEVRTDAETISQPSLDISPIWIPIIRNEVNISQRNSI